MTFHGGPSSWETGGHHPGLVLVVRQEDLGRVGNCWMKGRLKVGDIIMCISHSGDCFWNYMLLEHMGMDGFKKPAANVYRLIEGAKFGAYSLGAPSLLQPTTREMHLLLAGESVSVQGAFAL